ncbi:MAG: calcium/proton exchanger [Flavobacteriales bacterium]|nr:calcium/proton exchanger [Flavobacteriales bacterium]
MANDLLKHVLKPSMDWLFVFIPITLWMEHTEASVPMIFFSAALAIIPIAHLIVSSTEKIAVHTGDAVGGLLNATFGNAPELIISMVALKAGMHELVLGSLAGALLANLMLSIGLSFFLGGLKYKEQSYNPASVRLYSTMMLIAVISLLVPSAFFKSFNGVVEPEVMGSFNLWLAGLLLAGYVLYLLFSLRTHKHLFQAVSAAEEHQGPKPNLLLAVVMLVGASVLAAWMSEILVGAAEGTGHALGLSPAFIGMVILAVVGGAAESFSAVSMARKDRMDMTLGIAMGSCVQIALFVTPVLVISSFFMGGEPFVLRFGGGAIIAVLLSVLVSAFVASDGKSNWYKGVQLMLVYLIIASMLYFVPEMK